jgi:hypothetical protein
MRPAGRWRPRLKRFLTSLPWLGLLGWAMSYSFLVAFLLYVIFDRVMFDKYWLPERLPGGDT